MSNRAKPPYEGWVVVQASSPVAPLPAAVAAVRIPPADVPVQVIPAVGATQTLAFSPEGIAVWDVTLTEDCEFKFNVPNPKRIPAGVRQVMYVLVHDVAGNHHITWHPRLRWRSGAVPTFVPTTGGQYLITIMTDDAGASFVAALT